MAEVCATQMCHGRLEENVRAAALQLRRGVCMYKRGSLWLFGYMRSIAKTML